ncbi:MAG: vWA domain-containing protein, partial [Kiritimatiellia bacterium]
MSKFGLGLAAFLAACLVRVPDSTAEPRCDQVMLRGEGAVPSHAILRISSCRRVSASCFEVYLVPQDEEPQPSYRVKRVFPWYHGEECLLMVRGWPDALTGPARAHVVIRSDGIIYRLVAPNPIRIRHPSLAVVLVVDDSYSMRRTDPERLRVHAVRLFVEMASKRPELESCALVAFSKRPRLLFGPGAPVVGQALETALQSLVAQGPTDLDGALRLADQVLNSVTADRQVVVVLSDGRDEPGIYEETHRLFVEKNRPIYTIGLSELADSVTLRRIAAETGGRFFFAAEARSLPQIFQEIALSFDRTVCVTRWRTEEGQEKFVPVDDSVKLISFVLGQDPGVTVTVGPRGERWEYRLDVDLRDTFVEFPVSVPGQWTLRALGRKSGTVTVVAKSDLEFLLFSTPVLEKESGVVQVAGVLVHGIEPLLGARCQVSLVARDGPAVVGMLHDDGQHNDGEANDGIYAGQIILPFSGSYRGAIVAKGRTSAGHEFERMIPVGCEFEQPIAVSKLPPTAFPRTETRLAWPLQRPETGPAATELVKNPGQASPGMFTVEPVEPEASAVTQTVVITAEPKGVEETEQEETVGAMGQTHAVREVPPVESSQVASPSRGGLPLLFWLLLLGHLLLLLFWLLSRYSRHLPRMARYFALSTAIHCLLAMLVLDILVGTAPVVTERIAPQLAVQIQAVREALGLEVAVPTGAIHLPETRTVIELPSPQTRVGSDDGMIAPQVPPVSEMTALPSMSPPETKIAKQMTETVAQESKARPPLDEPTEAAREVPQKIQAVQRLERMQAITAERLSALRAGEERRINVAELPVELSLRNLELMPLAPDTGGKTKLIAETITKNLPRREEVVLESIAVSSRKVTETQVSETPQAANVEKEATESAGIPMRSATQPSLEVTEKVSLIAPIAVASSPLPLAKTELVQAKAAGAVLPRETERIEALPRVLGEQKKIVPPYTGANPRDVVVLPQVDRGSETATVTRPSPDRSGSVPLLAHAQPLPSVSPRPAVEQQLRLESEDSKRRMKTDEIAEVFETTFAGMMAHKSIAQVGEVGMTTQMIEKISLVPSKHRTGYTPSMAPHRPGVRVTARSPVIVSAQGCVLPVEGVPEQSLRAVAQV